MNKIFLAGLVTMFVAAQATAGEVNGDGAWTRATAPGQDTAMVQMIITSKQNAKLIGVSSKAAKTAELHSMVHENGVMKMRQIDELELRAGKALDFGEAGYHLMLLGLKEPLKEGAKTEVVLTVRLADGKENTVGVEVIIKPLTATGNHERMHRH